MQQATLSFEQYPFVYNGSKEQAAELLFAALADSDFAVDFDFLALMESLFVRLAVGPLNGCDIQISGSQVWCDCYKNMDLDQWLNQVAPSAKRNRIVLVELGTAVFYATVSRARNELLQSSDKVISAALEDALQVDKDRLDPVATQAAARKSILKAFE